MSVDPGPFAFEQSCSEMNKPPPDDLLFAALTLLAFNTLRKASSGPGYALKHKCQKPIGRSKGCNLCFRIFVTARDCF
jgi:hypothetical protein